MNFEIIIDKFRLYKVCIKFIYYCYGSRSSQHSVSWWSSGPVTMLAGWSVDLHIQRTIYVD